MTAAEKFLRLYEELAALPEGIRGEVIASVKTTVPKPSRPAEAVGRLQLPRAVGRPVARERGKLALDQLA